MQNNYNCDIIVIIFFGKGIVPLVDKFFHLCLKI